MFSSSLGSITKRLLLCALPLLMAQLAAQQTSYSTAHRNAEQTLSQDVQAGTSALASKASSGRVPVSLVVADFDEDGTRDLITGYAAGSSGMLLLQRGDPLALAPKPAQIAEIKAGHTLAPYLSTASAVDLPARPDLLVAADIAGHGHKDLVLAAKGDTKVYLLSGNGDGTFAAAQAFPLSGTVGTLAAWRSPEGKGLIAAGVCGSSGCGIQFLSGDGSIAGFVAVSGMPRSLEAASVNNGPSPELIVPTPESVLVIDGASALSGTPQTASLPVSGAVASAVGLFAYDGRAFMQIAVLDGNGTLHVFGRSGSVKTVPTQAEIAASRKAAARGLQTAGASASSFAWTEVETVSGVGQGGPATLLRGRFSGGGNDDLVVLSGTQYTTVSHPITATGNQRQTTPVVTVDSSSAPVTEAVAARISPSAQMGVIALTSSPTPLFSVPASTHTFTVNTPADATPTSASITACTSGSGTCTLRSAIAAANADSAANGTSHVDTINLPAGTFVISATNGSTTDSYGSFNYHFDVDASVNFVGAGTGSTVINANGVDKAFSLNSGVVNPFAPFDIFFSNLTIEKGSNKNDDQCGSCDFYGGNIDWDSGGVGTLGFTNVLLTGGSMPNSNFGGGGLFTSNVTTGASSPSGLTEFDTSTISNNTAPSQGGGLNITSYAPLTLNTDTLSGNTALPLRQNSTQEGYGGALWAEVNPNIGPGGGATTNTAIAITNSTFTSNTAHDFGGAMALTNTSPTISGTAFTSNSAGGFGGGIYLQGTDNAAPTITTSSFTANALTGTNDTVFSNAPFPTNGAAICVDPNETSSYPSRLVMTYSRLHGNTGGHATGLGIGCTLPTNATTADATVTATDDWWGCNPTNASNGISGPGCDTASAATYSGGSITLTTSPYTTLAVNVQPSTANLGASVTATGSLGQNSSGTIYTQANDLAYIGVPASLTLTDVSSTSTSGSTLSATANPAVSYAAVTATGTASAGGTGTATVTVDGFSLGANYTVTAPDLTVASTHTGNFKAGDTADTYLLTATNSGNGPTSGAVTLTDVLPTGFTATAIAGTGWTCTLGTLTCTRSDVLAAGASYPAVTLTVSVSSSDAGTYSNTARVSGGGETNTGNDSGSDTTLVLEPPTITEGFNPTSIVSGANSAVTFTFANPSANPAALTGVGVSDTLPAGLTVSTPNGLASTCSGATATAAAGSTGISVSGATLAAGASCTVTVNVTSSVAGSYTNTTGAVTATNSNAGGTASAILNVNKAAPSITVPTASVVYGTANATLTASVAYTGSAAPTGDLTFTVDSGTAIAATCSGSTSPLTCSASYPTSSLSGGSHTISANQAADANFNSGTGTGSLTVTKASPAVSVSNTSVTSGTANTTLTASVSYTGAAAPTGGVTFTVDSGSAVAGSCTGSTSPLTCSASYPTASLGVDNHTITVNTAADANYNAASGAGTLSVNQAPTESVTVSPSSIVYGSASTTLSASVAYTASTAPAGGLTFTVDNGSPIAGTCAGSSSPLTCTASYPIAALTVGNHTIAANAAADATYKTAATGTGTLTITQATPAVTVSSASISQGTTSATLIASVAYTGSAAPTAGLTFTVDSGTAVSATCTGASSPFTCTASYPTASLGLGGHTISATEAADLNYKSASGSATLTVTPALTASVTVGSTSVVYGTSSATVTATVGYTGSAAPTGGITFTLDSGSPTPGSCTGSASPLTCTATLPTASISAGAHTITATEAADSNYRTAASGMGTLTVTTATPGVGVSSTSIIQGTASTTLTATVSYVGSAAPNGGFSFTVDNGPAIAAACSGSSSPLTCTAAYPTSSLGLGNHTITGSEAASTNFSSAFTTGILTVNPAGSFTMTPVPPTDTIKRGVVGSFVLELSSVNGFDGNVTLNCSGGPAGTECVNFPETITVNGTASATTGILFPPKTKPGTYTLTFTGVSGSVTASTTAQFTVR